MKFAPLVANVIRAKGLPAVIGVVAVRRKTATDLINDGLDVVATKDFADPVVDAIAFLVVNPPIAPTPNVLTFSDIGA